MNSARRYAAALVAVVAVEAAAHAQFDFRRQPDVPAWQEFKLDSKARVNLDFRNASVDAVLQMLSKASGVTIIKDPTLNGGITLQSPKPQSLNDAFSMLNAVLGLKNFSLRKDGNFLVVSSRQNNPFGGGGRGGFSPDQLQGMGGGFGGRSNQPQLRVYNIKYANAAAVARVINDAFINSGVQNQDGTAAAAPAIPGVPPGGGGGGNPFANFGRGGNQGGGGGFGGFGGRRGGFGGGGLAALSVVRASSDDYSNTVIVNAPSREHEQIERLIAQIDKQTDQPQQSRVFSLKFASATDLAPVVQNVLVSNAPRGRGGQGTQSVPIDQRFQQAARFGSTQAAFGTVVAEARTNTLVVTATEENLAIAAKIIDELDKEVTFESSTFVITLQNARADAVSQLLNQSFSGRNGTNNGGFNNFNATGRTQQNQNNRNRNGALGGNRPGGLNGGGRAETTPDSQNEPTDISLNLADPNAGSGELATTVSYQQGGAFRQFGGGGGNQGGGFGGGQNRAQQGRTGFNDAGQVVNVRDLTGQVVAVPDINTNSVIIVTSPENRAIVEQILNQLDKIPEQVMIETLIVEASLDATNKLGVEWSFPNRTLSGKTSGQGGISFGTQADTSQPQGLRYTLTGTQYSVFLQAVQGDSRFEVLSTPRIFTSNNSTAEINISQSLPYVTNQRTDNNGNLIFTYDFLDVGIVLNVTPRITSNGYVTMDVTQTANDFVGYTAFNAPIVNQREAQTTVSVRDGETVVLGGIIKNSVQTTVNKLPLLGDIPILGNLFKSTSRTKNKTELLVFLTPRVVRDATEARKLRDKTESEIQPKTREKIDKVLSGNDPLVETPDKNKETPKPAQKP